MHKGKNIGLIAHDARKRDMVEWVTYNVLSLLPHNLICTGTTGQLTQDVFNAQCPQAEKKILCLNSGPLGGDQQMGAMIVDDKLDILIFFTDPMSMQPHDVDIKALLRISSIENIVVATTRSTADFIISSPLFNTTYAPIKNDYGHYVKRITI
jgi:methylglyoxal synthase